MLNVWLIKKYKCATVAGVQYLYSYCIFSQGSIQTIYLQATKKIPMLQT